MNIEELRARAIQTIEIPGYSPDETVKVQVQKPRLMTMMMQGKIPNPLMGIATRMVSGGTAKGEVATKDVLQFYELYCLACLVSPTYEEFKDIMTDEQMLAIFNWAMGDAQKMSSFRPDKEDGPVGGHGEGVQLPAK